MAIVVDPDNIGREQVIFGTDLACREISLYDVGALVHISATQATGNMVGASKVFTDTTNGAFTTWGVAPGDILCIFTGPNAGHWEILTVDTATSLTMVATHPDFAADTGDDTVYEIRDPSGGSIADGVTEQALYSFAKEEWHTDSKNYGGDDLIRHHFPFEPITAEQFEIGGGDKHADWDWFSKDIASKTIKLVRTGGWAAKNTAGTTLTEFTGIVTLGSLDADTQVYYQQIDETTAPSNFKFLGAVNEPIQVWESGSDWRTYLKLFARKKGKTYAGSEIFDIGVTTIQTIVNRFPLAHTTDAAIAATDGAILGTSTFRGQGASLEGQTDGATSIGTTTFTSALADFVTAGVQSGDSLHITAGGADLGDFTISSVTNLTTLEIATDFEFSGWTASDTGITYTVTSTVITPAKTDGVLANVDGATGTLVSASADFVTDGVAAGDMVIITEAASAHRGVYKVVSVSNLTTLVLNTIDHAFTAQSSIDFYVVEPGMYLEYKETAITLGVTGDITFADANPDTITRASGSWITDGVEPGTLLTISGSTSNDGTYTVASRTALDVTLVATDSLVAEGPVAATVTAYDAFKRTVNGVVYGFHWRLYGTDALLSNCYQFVQHQLRQTGDIDYGPGTSRGDVTDLLMSYASPTGTTLDLYIDDLAVADTNNVTWTDATSTARLEAYVAAGTLSFNSNLKLDTVAEYTMFFTNDDAGDNTGRDFGTKNAIIVKDASLVDIQGSTFSLDNISFDYDYDGNIQRGAASAGVDAPVTVVAIGFSNAQYVLATGTIERSKSNAISLVAPQERVAANS